MSEPIDGELEEDQEAVAKEMFDAEYPKVDVVKGPAHAMKFVVMKAEGPQDPADAEAVKKAEASTASLNDRPDSDFAYIEDGGKKDESGKTTPRSKRHFPIYDAAHVRNALARAPQSPFGDKAMPKIRAAAKKFGIDVSKSQEEPVKKQPTSEKEPAIEPTKEEPVSQEPVKKAGGDLDPTEVLAEPEEAAPGDPAQPGSPAWEAVDAATARKWAAILARAKGALQVMSDRETQEAAVAGDDDNDAESAWDLEDACCAIDYAISVLAPFAVDEQSEAETDGELMEGVAKAMTQLKTADLDVIESLGPVKKAGRVLSAANEQAIRDAVSSLQKVLSSLPAAPEAVAKSLKEARAKEKGDLIAILKVDEEQVRQQVARALQPASKLEDVKKALADGSMEKIQLRWAPGGAFFAPVKKAKGDPMVPVYDENGKLCGMVEADDIVPIAAAPPAEGADKEPEPAPAAPTDDGSGAPADGAPADGSAAAAPAAAAPGAAAAPAAAEQQPVAKSIDDITELVRKAVTEALEKAEEGHQLVVKQLEGRVAHLEGQPAPGGPLLNGLATGAGRMPLRGHDGADEVPAELKAVQKQLEDALSAGNEVEANRLKRLLVLKTLSAGYSAQQPPVVPSGRTP